MNKTIDNYLNEAKLLIRFNKSTLAIKILNKLISDGNANSEIYCLITQANNQIKNAPSAEKVCTKILKQNFNPEQLRRINQTTSCHDCDYIPKEPNAGQIIPGNPTCQIMHNGIKILHKAFHGDWMSEIIRKLRGHHEPQEEKVFHEVLKRVPPNACMIELGSFWSYYSMWFNKSVTNAKNYMIEPNPEKYDLGKKHFHLNNMKGNFTKAFIGPTSIPNSLFMDWDHKSYVLPRISIDDFLDAKGIDFLYLLHSDIQGAEYQMLLGCQKSIAKKKFGYVFISTHGDCHEKCISFLIKHKFFIIASHTIKESFSADGLIVAASPQVPLIDLQISKKQRQQHTDNH